MKYIGKIDREIYRCVTKDIVTEDVIITDEQIAHIKDRHPSDYERYCEYFIMALSDPDYIIEANRPKTAIVLKEILEVEEHVKLVLRLCTSDDPKGYSNSIITFMKISDKRWNRYLRTKDILYKKE